jgi:hypothetical protein
MGFKAMESGVVGGRLVQTIADEPTNEHIVAQAFFQVAQREVVPVFNEEGTQQAWDRMGDGPPAGGRLVMERGASLFQVRKIHKRLQANERVIPVAEQQAFQDVLCEPGEEGLQILVENGGNRCKGFGYNEVVCHGMSRFFDDGWFGCLP